MVDSPPSIGRSHLSDVIVGSLYMITSAMCAAAYAVILMTIWRDEELRKISSYQLMFALGIFDVMQCLPHFITGLFTIFSHHYNVTLAKAISVFGTPCYVAYIVITLILAVNRFIQVVAPHLNLKLFSAPIVYAWCFVVLGLWSLFAFMFASPWATMLYSPKYYSWVYDFSLPLSAYVQKLAIAIEFFCIVVVVLLYSYIIVSIYITEIQRKRFFSNAGSASEVKILIQAVVIGVYCTVMNLLWHLSQVLPTGLWWQMALNFMWVANSGVYPLIYFIVNGTLRGRIAHRRTGGATTMAQRTIHKPSQFVSSFVKVNG
ncbi:hypothetical protein Q1695_007531 [Nippostrongylus brasiliensis]|nr:hypothetical protein Q1695_007531 [Nippostrongylus brasiliensis]